MAALSGVQRLVCPEQQIRRTCSRLRQLFFRGVYVPVRAFCLPAISLTRTPGGRHAEWAAACFDPCFERLEKSVYFIGLVSHDSASKDSDITTFSLTHTAVVFLSSSGWNYNSGGDLLHVHCALPVAGAAPSDLLTVLPVWPLPPHQYLLPLLQGSLH